MNTEKLADEMIVQLATYQNDMRKLIKEAEDLMETVKNINNSVAKGDHNNG